MLIAVFSSSAVTTTVSLVHAVAILRVGGFIEVLCAIVEVSFSHTSSAAAISFSPGHSICFRFQFLLPGLCLSHRREPLRHSRLHVPYQD